VKGGRNVLYVDGHVTWRTEEEFQRDLKATKEGAGKPLTVVAPKAAGEAKRPAAQPGVKNPLAEIARKAQEDPDALVKDLLSTFQLSLLPPAGCVNRHLFASAGVIRTTGDGVLCESHGPFPFINSPGLGGAPPSAALGLPIIAAIAIPNLLRSKMAANESAAIAAMRTYAGAQNIFHRTDYDGDGILEYCGPGQQGEKEEHVSYTFLNTAKVNGMPIELIDSAFANARLGAPGAKPKAGYYFIEITKDADGNDYNAAFCYGLCAVPAQYNRSGLNTFVIDVQGTVFQRDNGGQPVTQFPDVDDEDEPWIVCE
jgi:prepilin-type processing-associated H-X9-DG protein